MHIRRVQLRLGCTLRTSRGWEHHTTAQDATPLTSPLQFSQPSGSLRIQKKCCKDSKSLQLFKGSSHAFSLSLPTARFVGTEASWGPCGTAAMPLFLEDGCVHRGHTTLSCTAACGSRVGRTTHSRSLSRFVLLWECVRACVRACDGTSRLNRQALG
jgi:hypothetical protein